MAKESGDNGKQQYSLLMHGDEIKQGKWTYGIALMYSANQYRQDFHVAWHRTQKEKNCKAETGNASFHSN